MSAATMMIAAADARGDSSEALKDLGRRYWDAYLEHHPTLATSLGDYRFNDRLEDLGAASRGRWQQQLRKFHAELRKLPSSKLSEEDRLTRALLERTLSDAMLLFECRLFLTPLDPLYGPHIRFPLILVSQPFGSAEDFRNYVSRLRAFPEQVRSMIADMRTGVAAGITSPRIIVEKVIPQIRAHIVAEPRKSEFYKPIAKATNLGLSPDERVRLEADVVAAIQNDVVPAFLQLLAFVEDDYIHKCRSTVGLGAIKNGDRAYQALTRIYTTVPITVDEIHGIGLDEVRRLRGEMEKVRGEMGFEGDLEAFIQPIGEGP
ncbi:MAG: DUF885 domain-containing protein, partial [Planctomycetes bacterium]|nr:DUF885 domain-containing protein [Planctomycetota bacterium]